jgi:hypothetical protein
VIKSISKSIEGCGIWMFNSNPEILCNTVYGNRAPKGAGIFMDGYSYPVICSNRIVRNRSEYGAIYIEESKPVLMNNLIFNNETEQGGGIFLAKHAETIMANNTIAMNVARVGGALMFTEASDATIYNSVIWGNKANFGAQVFLRDKECDPNFIHCDIENGDLYHHGFGGAGAENYNGMYLKNIDTDPRFDKFSHHFCSLLPSSPCIDTATPKLPVELPCTDICGNNRISGKELDMGAYEYQHLLPEDDILVDCDSAVQLHGHFPNPANPNTVISFTVLEEGKVTISIFNMKGQLIKQLTGENYAEGLQEVSWNGTDLSGKSVTSGVYFYKLKAGKKQVVRKLVLLK